MDSTRSAETLAINYLRDAHGARNSSLRGGLGAKPRSLSDRILDCSNAKREHGQCRGQVTSRGCRGKKYISVGMEDLGSGAGNRIIGVGHLVDRPSGTGAAESGILTAHEEQCMKATTIACKSPKVYYITTVVIKAVGT